MSPSADALFAEFPLTGEATLSTGVVPTPYHVYDGHALFIGGTADLAAARVLLASEQAVPVQTADGRALMAVWVCEFAQASLGPHCELQVSIFAGARERPPVGNHPLELIRVMLMEPEVKMLCHGLWNDALHVVAYNRELLALNARPTCARIERRARVRQFEFVDSATAAPIVSGVVHRTHRPSWHAAWELLRLLGLRRAAALARAPHIKMQILNPVGERLDRNAVADSYTKTARASLRYFSAAEDRLVIATPQYAGLHFRPQFFQVMEGFKFVYLAPA